jgi:transposase-like protein
MDLKTQIIREYLTQGTGFRKLASKYGISRTTICKWVAIYQGIHNLPLTEKQKRYSTSSMNSSPKKSSTEEQSVDALEKDLNIPIRKKPGAQQ